MGKSHYCKKKHTKKCAWNKKKDRRLINYINIHGQGCWRSLSKAVGLLICGKSCKLRWINYVPPDLKRVNITEREAELIIRLQNLLGNKWTLIAVRLPGSTDKEIKNYWKTHLKNKLYNRGLDHQTHRLNTPTATATAADPVAVVNINNNDGSCNNNNGKFQKLELEQYISCFQASSFSQREICDPLNGHGGSASVHVASNRVTRDLIAVKKEDAATANSISESANFSKWKKGESIGSGGYGIVYVARNRETGALCAVKELKNIYKLENIKSIQKEIDIFSQLEHINIVKYYGHEIVGCHISLYMEYVQPGSLKKYILDQGVLPEPLIRNFTRQILSGLAYLHSKRVVHRDIKPDNLLVSFNNIVKLGDFGLAKQLEESVGNHSMLGTPYYAAPKVFDQKIEYQSSHEAYGADIWSLGCVIIEMFSGNHPWPGFDPVQVIFNVHVKQQHPSIPEKLCRVGKDLLELCFIRTPADRPSALALLDHPFVKTTNNFAF